jgi:uncharacterized protein DUF6527
MIARLDDPWFEAQFVGNAGASGHRRLSSIDGAQGIFLWCPCAYGNDARAHGLIVPFANPRGAPVPPHNFGMRARGGGPPPRWQMAGSGIADLSLSPSIDVGEPSCWHGFITNGVVT